MSLHRCFAAVIIGSIAVLVVLIVVGCVPSQLTETSFPTIPQSPEIRIPPTPTPTPHPVPPTTVVWFLVDRSNSMKRCADSERKILYQLPGFLAQVAAVLSSNRGSTFSVAEVLFPLDKDLHFPTPASEAMKDLRNREVSITHTQRIPWNEYGKALRQVSYSTGSEERRVVLILTDGTFSETGESQREQRQREEREEIERELQHIKKQKNTEVYLIYCHHPSSLEAWNSPTITSMLSGTYGLGNLPEWIEELGNVLFRDWLHSSEIIQTGWLTSSTIVALPGETITFSVDIIPLDVDTIPLDSGAEAWIDYMGNRHYLTLTDAKVFVLNEGFVHSKPDDSCESREMRLHLRDSAGRYPVGQYLIRNFRTPLVKEIQVEMSVNHQPATVTFSLKGSPDFDPAQFVQCYEIELISKVATASGQFQNSLSTLTLTLPPETEPGDYPGILSLKNRKGNVLADYPITLPIRFQPTPSGRLAKTLLEIMVAEKDRYAMSFEYKYVPPEVRPQIFLCSSLTPTETEEANRNLSCGKAPCCSGGGSCSIICPTPPCPLKSDLCPNCVPVEFSRELCAPDGIAVASQHRGPSSTQAYATETYTVTMYKCLAEEKATNCGYTGLLFFWPEGPKVVTTTYYFKRAGNTWILQQQP